MQTTPKGANKSPREYLVELRMENRSYDHMLAYLPNGLWLTGEGYNYDDPANPESEKVYVSKDSGSITLPNPAHEVGSI